MQTDGKESKAFHTKQLYKEAEEIYNQIRYETMPEYFGNVPVLDDIFIQMVDKKVLMKKILSALEQGIMNIDGFVRFRMQKELVKIQEAFEIVANQCRAQAEYEYMIRLMQEYVNLGSSVEEMIHIHCNNGAYELYDKKFRLVTNFYHNLFVKEEDRDIMSQDDFLLHTLLHMNPKKIIVHGFQTVQDKNIFKTIEEIFHTRFIQCQNCVFCKEGFAKQQM